MTEDSIVLHRDLLDDLCARFLLPLEDLSCVRIFSTIERAWWFYTDFKLSKLTNGAERVPRDVFFKQLFLHCPMFKDLHANYDTLVKQWYHIRKKMDRNGCVILDSTNKHILLVKPSFRANASWMLPKGKVDFEEENSLVCAIRETFEETGIDVKDYISPTAPIRYENNGHVTKYFFVTGVPLNILLQTQTYNEIGVVKWHQLKDLPDIKDTSTLSRKEFDSFNAILPLLPDIRRFVLSQRKGHSNYVHHNIPAAMESPITVQQQLNQSIQPSPGSKVKKSPLELFQDSISRSPGALDCMATNSSSAKVVPKPCNNDLKKEQVVFSSKELFGPKRDSPPRPVFRSKALDNFTFDKASIFPW